MGYKMTEVEIQLLKDLVGKKISTSGYCDTEDEHGVGSTVDIALAEGVLREIKFDEETGDPKTIIVDDPRRSDGIELVVQIVPSQTISNFHRGIYHNGAEILSISPD